MPTVLEIVKEFLNRQKSNAYESVVIKDGRYSERFSQITNLKESPGKIEFDYNSPVEWIDGDFRREWLHKTFEGAEVMIVERNKWIRY